MSEIVGKVIWKCSKCGATKEQEVSTGPKSFDIFYNMPITLGLHKCHAHPDNVCGFLQRHEFIPYESAANMLSQVPTGTIVHRVYDSNEILTDEDYE